MRWLRGLGVIGAVVVAATVLANPARADAGVTPGIKVDDESSSCTAGFAAQGNDGSYYLMTSGHCDAHDGSLWTYGNDVPLGKITASEQEGDTRDAAIIRLDPNVGEAHGRCRRKVPGPGCVEGRPDSAGYAVLQIGRRHRRDLWCRQSM